MLEKENGIGGKPRAYGVAVSKQKLFYEVFIFYIKYIKTKYIINKLKFKNI